MDPARWERVQAVFLAALDRPEAERATFLDVACQGEPALRLEVLRLLDGDARETVLDASTATVARAVLGSSPHSDLRGSTVGPYRFVSKLGEGGSGVVYLAERDDIGSQVAIKVLRDAWVSPSRRNRFLAEQRTLAQLRHPGIAPIVDAGVEAGVPWFAMEYVAGLPLDQYCEQHLPDLRQRVRLVRQVCAAVQYAHERLFVHRDLKPSNILVQADGRARLVDFGIARHLAPDVAAEEVKGPLRFLTPEYSAPEELSGEPAGVVADVFSLGAILRELGASAVGQSPRAKLLEFDAICLKAMATSVSARYASVEALGRDLDAFLAEFPVLALPGGAVYRGSRFVARHTRAVAAALVLGVLIGGVSVYYARQLTEAEAETRAEAARAGRLLRFVLNLFEGGASGGVPAADLRVLSLLERGVIEARGLAADPEAQADILLTLGGIHRQLGDLPRAEALLNESLAARHASPNSREGAEERSLLALAELQLAQARLDDAGRTLDRVRLLLDGRRAVSLTLEVQLLVDRGRLARDLGDYPTAAAQLDAAIRLSETAPADQPELADALATLAEVEFYRGDMSKADLLNERALSEIRRMRGGTHPDIGHALLTRGAILAAESRHADAETVYREALAILTRWYGGEHPESASAMTILAQMLGQQSRFDEAMPLVKRAVDVQTRVFGPRHPRTAFVQNELGLIAFRMNDLASAGPAFSAAADGYRGVPGKHFQEGVSLANLGSVHMAREDYVAAEKHFRQALLIYADAIPPGHLNVAIARAKLGRALLRQGRRGEARPELEAARAVLERQPGEPSSWLLATRDDLAAVVARN